MAGDLPKVTVELTESPFFVGPRKPVDEEELSNKVAEALRPFDKSQRAYIADELNRHFKNENERAKADVSMRDAIMALKEWSLSIETSRTPFRLEKNDCSRLHVFKEAFKSKLVIGDADGALESYEYNIDGSGHTNTFVVKHDWASAFEGAAGIDEEEGGIGDAFKLPYDLCCFEFRISGKTVLVFARQESGSGIIKCLEFWESNGYWYCPPPPEKGRINFTFLTDQIRAICIALDAEVATETVVRAPHKLNEKRSRSGKVPLSDYHVVDLAKRHRIANPINAGTGSEKRLHFRRGHYRHFETYKTWIKWCLVGNPDLGFIQKQYSL